MNSHESLRVIKEFGDKLDHQERGSVHVENFDSLELRCALYDAEKWYRFYQAFRNLKGVLDDIEEKDV